MKLSFRLNRLTADELNGCLVVTRKLILNSEAGTLMAAMQM